MRPYSRSDPQLVIPFRVQVAEESRWGFGVDKQGRQRWRSCFGSGKISLVVHDDDIPEDERVYINIAAQQLDRRIGTLRKWEQGILPEHLMPRRGKRNWRYWTQEQVDAIRQWMIDTDRRPGRALPHISSDPQKVEMQIHAMRKPREKRAPVPTNRSEQ